MNTSSPATNPAINTLSVPEVSDTLPDTIVCQDLTKQFGDFVAVDNLNLRVKQGELFGFLGPNGAGKTTTIKMITGLLRPTSGFTTIGGYDVQQAPLEAKKVFGYIPDNPFLYEKLTGREYLYFMADLYGVVLQNRVARVNDLLQLFELKEKGDTLVQGYSRGMRQKISLAGALIHAPKVVLLDEPTVGLDPKGARTMKDILRELSRRGTTVFISTHILQAAEQICDRLAIINRGKIIAEGTMEQLRDGTAIRNGHYSNGNGVSSYAQHTLEDIFLELTDGTEAADLARYLD